MVEDEGLAGDIHRMLDERDIGRVAKGRIVIRQRVGDALDELAARREGTHAAKLDGKVEKLKAELFYALDRLDWAYGHHDDEREPNTMKCQMCLIRDRLRDILAGRITGPLPKRIQKAIDAAGTDPDV